MFEARSSREAEADGAVLRHELGHVVAWFLRGGAIGPLELVRDAGDTLRARAVLVHRSPKEEGIPAVASAVAERLLAGEVAVRRHLRARADRITLGHDEAASVVRGHDLAAVRGMCGPEQDDLAKVLDMAMREPPEDAWRWLMKRHVRAIQLVDRGWDALDALASDLQAALPTRAGDVVVVWGTDLLARLHGSGLSPLAPARPPIEALPLGLEGGPRVWMKRLSRRFGALELRWRRTRAVPRLASLGARARS